MCIVPFTMLRRFLKYDVNASDENEVVEETKEQEKTEEDNCAKTIEM